MNLFCCREMKNAVEHGMLELLQRGKRKDICPYCLEKIGEEKMPEAAIKQTIRRLKEKTAKILDNESFHVNEATGKAEKIYDFFCFDKSCYKITKVCLDTIQPLALSSLLFFRESPFENPEARTIIQIFFWHHSDHSPFYRAKLYYGQPKQVIPEELEKLVR